MYFLYSLLLGLGVLALLPRFVFDALRHGKYAAGLAERAGRVPRFDAGGRPVLWLHCVSVGETQAAPDVVGETAEGRQIVRRVERHAVLEREPLARLDLRGDVAQFRVV